MVAKDLEINVLWKIERTFEYQEAIGSVPKGLKKGSASCRLKKKNVLTKKKKMIRL